MGWSTRTPVGHGPTGSSDRVTTGAFIPDNLATLGPTPTAMRPAGLSPVTRGRVVLLPHTQTEPTDTRPTNRPAARATGMNQDDSPRRHLAQSDGTTRAVTVSRQWHDVELAVKAARHSFDRWVTADQDDTPFLATMHARHARTAAHEAERAITNLIDTLHTQEMEPSNTPARNTENPTQRR
ncbi:MAG: hypothetical protein ACRDQX_06450 [Pseudonocardiaceae bacterium]